MPVPLCCWREALSRSMYWQRPACRILDWNRANLPDRQTIGTGWNGSFTIVCWHPVMHRITGAGWHDRPVFVLAQHRSGGTLLARLLNCHPGLVIWGEHAGFINRLAEAHELLVRHHDLLPDRNRRQVRR